MRLKLYCCFECSELCIVFLVYHLHGPIKNRHGKKGLGVKQDGPGGGWDPGLDTTCAVFTIHYVVEGLFAKHLNPILTWRCTKLFDHDLIAIIIIGLKYVKTNHIRIFRPWTSSLCKNSCYFSVLPRETQSWSSQTKARLQLAQEVTLTTLVIMNRLFGKRKDKTPNLNDCIANVDSRLESVEEKVQQIDGELKKLKEQISSKSSKLLFDAFGQTEKTGFKVFGHFSLVCLGKCPKAHEKWSQMEKLI